MTSKDFLSLHLCLLLAEHGESRVLEALALLLDSAPVDLQVRLADLRKIRHARSKKRTGASKGKMSIETLLSEHPDKADLIREIQERFLERTYLPELKDVRRFLDRHGQPSTTLKKRDDGFAIVARQLVLLSQDELRSILSEPTPLGYSSLGIISDQILGRT